MTPEQENRLKEIRRGARAREVARAIAEGMTDPRELAAIDIIPTTKEEIKEIAQIEGWSERKLKCFLGEIKPPATNR